MQDTSWPTILKRTDLVGGTVQVTERGHIYHGTLSSIVEDDDDSIRIGIDRCQVKHQHDTLWGQESAHSFTLTRSVVQPRFDSSGKEITLTTRYRRYTITARTTG